MNGRRCGAAAAVLAMAALPALGGTVAAADSGSAFDASNLKGQCAALELTVKTGYSFIVQPDIQVPRALTDVEEGQSEAISSPADPGDSVDGLTALGIPEAEGYLVNGYPGAPSPFAGRGLGTMPAPINSVGAALLKNPFNPALEYPYEHADAGYPNAQSAGTQTATLGGSPQATYTDPSGVLSVDAATAKSVAGDGLAVADAGAGPSTAATTPATPAGLTSIPGLGVSVGRISAHSEAHILANSVTEDATCTLQDVEIAVPGAAPLHIGAVVARVHAERVIGAPHATSTERIEFSGVTVNGQGATLDQHGLTVAGHQVTTLPQAASPPVPAPVVPGSPVSTTPPTVSIAGSRVTQQNPSADEAVVAATGATVTITSTTPIPNAIPPSGVANTPTVYTLQIASLAGEAYGLAASPSSTGGGVGLGDVASSVANVLGGGLGSAGSGGTVSGTGAAGHPGHAGQPASLASVAITPMQRTIVLLLSSLLEGLVLLWAAANYLRSRRHVAAPVESTDLP